MLRSILLCSLTAILPSLFGCGSYSSAEYGGGEGSSSHVPADLPQTGSPPQGLLTAGDWDDNLNFALYQKYLQDRPHGVELLPVADRVVITVRDGGGQTVSNARVSIDDGTKTYLTAPTGSDGRILFFPTRDGATQAGQLTLRVAPPADQPGVTPVSMGLQAGQSTVDVALPGAQRRLPQSLDLAFVVDVTGSMGDELNYLKNEIGDIAGRVRGDFPQTDLRYGLVLYQDIGDVFVTRSFNFTSDLAEFQRNINAQGAGGGGDYPEAMDLAAQAMNQLSWRSGNTARVAFLVADAPPHDDKIGAFLSEVSTARRAGIHIYPVGASGVGVTAEYVMRAAAEETLSRYLFLTDDSGIGNSHADPHVPCYEVQYLKLLMSRAIATEISGVRPAAAPGDILRTVGDPMGGVCKLSDGTEARLY